MIAVLAITLLGFIGLILLVAGAGVFFSVVQISADPFEYVIACVMFALGIGCLSMAAIYAPIHCVMAGGGV